MHLHPYAFIALSGFLFGLTILPLLLIIWSKRLLLSSFFPPILIEKEKRSAENKNPSISPDLIRTYRRRIDHYLEKERPFLDPDFRMRTMVEATGIPRHHLSSVINTTYKKNFNQLINEYRMDYIKRRINDPEWRKLTLEGIGMEAGFRSRSTFLLACKKNTGMTPSELRNQEL